jgi:hypothetical protein
MNKLPNNRSSGQAVLIILLVMAVILTIGLSVVSRSVTDINMSQQSEDSARAFSAAEAGIEQALLLGTSGTVNFQNTSTSVSISTSDVGMSAGGYVYPTQIQVDEITTIWLSNYNNTSCPGENYCSVVTGSNLRVYWGNSGTASNNSFTPAIETSIYYKDAGDAAMPYKVAKFVLDPHTNRMVPADQGFCVPGGSLCAGVSNFIINGENISTQAFQFAATLDISPYISLPNKFPLLARLRLLYSMDKAHFLGANLPNGTFPSQGKDIYALGTSGKSSSKVHAFRPKPAPPAIFDFALYSGTDLHHEQ